MRPIDSVQCSGNSPPRDTVSALAAAQALQADAVKTGHRRLLLIEGSAAWTLEAAQRVASALAPNTPRWIGTRFGPHALPPSKAPELLGGECDLLVYDLHGGLDADALGAAVGTLRGGGLLLLLTPPLEQWPALIDPEAGRIAVHPFTAADVGRRFVARLARLFAQSPTVHRCRETGGGSETLTTQVLSAATASHARVRYREVNCLAPLTPGTPATPDQQQAVDAICHLARTRARRPLVLTADRGRGKSAALGIAAARLLREHPLRIIVTAPRRTAADALFDQATAGCPTALQALRFVPPDALLAERPAADLLLVDEAAGIPAPLLGRMLDHYGLIVFATTVHGYEGTGRGFDVRFRATLDARAPGWRALRLTAPIRWAQDDPLEQLINQALLLDAEPAADDRIATLDLGSARFETLDRDYLAGDEPLLRQVFGLLVLGHYQTRPADLRHLLDGPNLAVSVLRTDDAVLATALTAEEGALADELLIPIFDGRRRPRGHLLPQTLSAHAGVFDAPRLQFTRIVRIAVHPAARQRGLGTRLVEAVTEQANNSNHDLIGASFGARPELLRFWRRCGLVAAQLGTHRNAASGAHAAVVLRALSESGQGLLREARERLLPRLAVQLAGPLRQVEPAILTELLHDAPTREPPLTPAESRELQGFADALRSFEAALPVLHRTALLTLPRALQAKALDADQAAAFIAHVLQYRDWSWVDGPPQHQGKAERLRLLRAAARRLAYFC